MAFFKKHYCFYRCWRAH